MGVPLHRFNCDFTIDVDRKLVVFFCFFFCFFYKFYSFSLHAFLQELVTYVTDKNLIFSQV